MNSLTKVFSGKHARINLRVEETLTGAVLTMRINEQDEAFVSKNESDEKKFQASNGVKIKSHSHPALQFVRFGSKQILTVFLRGRNKIDGGDFATMDVNSYNDGKYLLEHILLALDEWDASFDKISNKEASTIKEVFKLIADAQEDMNPKINVLAEVKKMKELRAMYEDAKQKSEVYMKKAQGYQDEMVRIKQRAKKHIDLI